MNRFSYVLLLAASGAVLARKSPSPQVLRATTTAVTADVVVHDRDGKPVTDLTGADFTLYEDGVRQDIADVQLVAPSAEPGSSAAASDTPLGSSGSSAHGAPAAVTAPTFVALVFDRLSPEARYLAYKGAQAYLATRHDNDFAGVFLSDLSLVTVQQYTNDRAKIAKALKDVASRPTSTFDLASIRSKDCLDCGDDDPSVPFVAGADSPGRVRSRPQDRIPVAAQIMRRGDELWERLERNAQGFSTTNALIALASALGPLPGRKTVVFFAEGLRLPDAVMPQFQSVVAAANRANVSIYTIDAAGLRVHSQQQETGRGVNAIGALGLETGLDGQPLNSLRNMDWLEDALARIRTPA